MAPSTSEAKTPISRTPQRFETELPGYLSPTQLAEREGAGFGTRNGVKSTKSQTHPLLRSIASCDASQPRATNLALFSKS